MAIIIRNIIFKPTEIDNYESSNGRYMQSQNYIKFNGNFNGTRRVVSSITISSQYLSEYLNTDANPSTPYVPQYPGSPATKKYVDDNIPTKVSDLTNDSNFQTDTQVNQAISAAVSSAYKYKGSVANQAALPASGNTTGDVWNTEDTGMNYAWTGSAWDALGTIVDLSGKQDKLIAGSNIQIASDGKTISATDTKYTAGTGISIDANNVISNTQTSAEWGNITGTLSDQTDLQNALNTKADKEDVNVKVFHIASTNDLTNAQAAIDRWEQGRLTGAYTPLIEFGGGKELYGLLAVYDGFQAVFTALAPETTQGTSKTTTSIKQVIFSLTGTPGQPQTVTAISTSNYLDINYLDTDASYSSPYAPSNPGNPATKKYVDDNINTKTFYISNQQDLTNAQAALDWHLSGKNSIIVYNGYVFVYKKFESNKYKFIRDEIEVTDAANSTVIRQDLLYLTVSGNTVTAIGVETNSKFSILSLSHDYSSPYTPLYNGSPATKKYVDDNIKTYTAGTGIDITSDTISTTNNFGTSSTAAATVQKEVSIPGIKTLNVGQVIHVLPSTTNTVANSTIKLNDFTAYPMRYNNAAITTSTDSIVRPANIVTSFVFDGTYWQFIGHGLDSNTTYSAMTTNEATTGTSATSRTISASVLKGAIQTHAPVKSVNGQTGDVEFNAGEGIEIKDSDYSAMQGPAPAGYHIPSKNEWVALRGILITTFSMAANATTMGTYLKMPMAGYRLYSSSSVDSLGSFGGYWSSTAYSTERAYSLSFGSSSLNPQNDYRRAYGESIRCFKDTPVTPDSSWTTLYDGSSVATGAGVFYNATDGLISLSGDGATWYTIQDKNLGATTVYNQGDALTDANCGYFYQWGNNYGFAHSGNVTTSSTQVDASSYGPGNYYSSNTFITRIESTYDRSSVQNDNLWGGVTGVLENAITNTGVLSVNGQTGNVTIAAGLQVAPNSPITGIKYVRYGTEAQYEALTQYYTDTPGDTEFRCF